MTAHSGERARPVASGSSLLEFEVVQSTPPQERRSRSGRRDDHREQVGEPARLAACSAAADTGSPSAPGSARVAVAPATTVGAVARG